MMTEPARADPRRATLRVLEQKGPLRWVWSFSDRRGTVRREAVLDPTSAEDQVLLERNSMATWMQPTELRSVITDQLRRLLGPIAARIDTSPASTLYVSAPRAGHVALSLPFELVFRPGGLTGPVIRVVVRTQRMEPYAPPGENTERVAAAFALRGSDPYLPLHAEAAALAEIADRAGLPYDEHFVMFAAEDLLALTRDAAVVHLAGHGREGALSCQWRAMDAPERVASTDLIGAWRERPPRLVVLNFCESSSEADVRRLIEIGTVGGIELEEYAHRLLSPVPTAPSTSMALDLVAALPTAVLALRTVADDAQARAFSRSFYSHHLLGRLSVEEAYATTLAEQEFSDEIGLPIPTLYTSEALLPMLGEEPPPPAAPAEAGCLEPVKRRSINLFHRATGPLGRHLDGNWLCFFASHDADLKRGAEEAVRDAVELWDRLAGESEPQEPRTGSIPDHHTFLSRNLKAADEAMPAVDIHVECSSADVMLGELLASPRSLPFADLALIAQATCNVPLVLDAVRELSLEELAEGLWRAVDGRSLNVDRRAQWDLVEKLIGSLSPARAAEIEARIETKWRQVEALGPLAVDIVASHYVLGQRAWRFDEMEAALDYLLEKGTASRDEVRALLGKLIGLGIALPALSAVDEAAPNLLSIDMLTVSRAWAECSSEAAEAYKQCLVDREMQALPSDDYIAGVPTLQLAALAELCLSVRDPHFAALVGALERRADGGPFAEDLRGRADEDLLAGVELLDRRRLNDPWLRWDRAFQSGNREQATLLLEEIGGDSDKYDDHPLRLPVSRLPLMSEEGADGVLAKAEDLERQLLAMLARPGDNDLELGMLLTVRQVKARELVLNENWEEAEKVLVENFDQTRRHGHHPATWVFAGGSATSALTQRAPERAREVWGAVESDARALPVSAAKVFALTAELMLLTAERRWLQARAAAAAMVDELAAWREPRPDLTRIAVEWCAVAQLGQPSGFALRSLRRRVEGEFPTELNMDIDSRLLAELYQELALEEALAVGDDLAERAPAALAALGVSPAGLLDGIREDYALLTETPAAGLAELVLGDDAKAVLEGRAEDGCQLSATILLCVDPETAPLEGPPSEADFTPCSATGFEALAREHGTLRETLQPVLGDHFDRRIPWLTAAFRGDLEARALWIGLMIGDLQSQANPYVVEAQVALAMGEGARAQRMLLGGGELPPLAAMATAVEHCVTAPESEPADDPALEEAAASSWELLLAHAPDHRDIAAAALRALDCLVGPEAEPLEAILASASGEESLRRQLGVEAEESLAARVLAEVSASPEIQVSLAEARLKGGPEPAALDLLRHLDADAPAPLTVRIRDEILRAEVARQDDAGCAAGVDRLLQAMEGVDLSPAALRNPLRTLTTAGLMAGRYDVARAASEALVRGPARLEDPVQLISVYFNGFQAALLLDGFRGGGTMLGQVGADLGFSAACWMVAKSSLADLGEEDAEPLAEVLMELATEDGADPFATAMRPLREDVLREVEAAGRWPALAEAIKKGLRQT